MSEYDIYSKVITRSVNHIFDKFLDDRNITEVFESQSRGEDPKISIEIDGTLKGEMIINIPQKTLSQITKKFIRNSNSRAIKKHSPDVAGEIANLITGTFANQLQFADHNLVLSPPTYNEDPIQIKALYRNINLSFHSQYGGFDVDFFYRSGV